jgi:hypothetical protein
MALNQVRAHTKFIMSRERKGRCDVCGMPASDMHEIITRGRTVKNEKARELSFKKEICALLCRKCHENAHNPKTALLLLKKNVDRYGYAAVSEAFENVRQAMGGNTNGILMPEKEIE